MNGINVTILAVLFIGTAFIISYLQDKAESKNRTQKNIENINANKYK